MQHLKVKVPLNLFIFLALIFLFNESHAQWELKKDENGIQVYTAETLDGYKKFKGITTVDGSIDSMIKLLKDTKNAPKWMYQTEELQMIEYQSHYVWFTRTLVDLPWPVDDRDIVVRLSLSKIENGFKVNMRSEPKYIPVSDDYVRMEIAEGYWLYEKLDNGKVKVTYEFVSKPEGIPKWIINLFITDTPLETLSGMKSLIATSPYKEAHLKYLH